MKKYNLFDLYIVKTEDENGIYFLICKYNKSKDSFVEVFTDKKIKSERILSVESLSNKYIVKTFDKSEIELSKGDLLRKYLEINGVKVTEKTKNLILTAEENKLLETATLNFFPEIGKWYSSCFKRPSDLDMKNLPCHLRNEEWLTLMFIKDQELRNIDIDKVQTFIETSPFFKEKRHEYEQTIIKWQIEWMLSGGENWIADKNYGGEFSPLTSTYDLAFRKGVIDTLTKIGIDSEAIEEGIEKNSNIWRDFLMLTAFNNAYNPIYFQAEFTKPLKEETNHVYLEPADKKFKENWLKLRKYEYYQNHKESVDKYGNVESCMTLSEVEIFELKAFLKQKEEERKTQIEEYERKVLEQRNIKRNLKKFKRKRKQ